MTEWRRERLKNNIQAKLGLKPIYAIVGDGNSPANIVDPSITGNVYVQLQYANGYGTPISVRGPIGTSVQLNPGTQVELEYTNDKRLAIKNYNVTGGGVAGQPMLNPNLPQINSGGYLGQQSIVTALVTPQATPDLTVVVKAWAVISGGTYTEYAGTPSGGYDLTGSVPSAGNNCYAVLFLTNDFATLSVQTSTPRAITDLPLNSADIQQCITAEATTSTPLAVIRLYGGQTQILLSDIQGDLRQFLNLPNSLAGSVTSVGLALPTSIFTISGSPVTTSGTLTGVFKTQAANTVFAGPTTGAAATPAFRALVAADLPAGTGTVTSVAMTVPSILSVSGTPITTSGTLAVTLATQSANLVFAGPTTGSAATPTFRALVTADMPAGTGTVTSVAMTVPSILSVSGTPITTSGTLAVTLATQSANLIFAGPTSGGAATPAFRSMVDADVPTTLGIHTFSGILTTQSGRVRAIRVVTGAGAVTVTTADDLVIVNKGSGASTTVNLPSSPTTGQTFVIHDGKGDAATNNITITPAAGNINGAGTLVLNSAYATAVVTYNGTQWDAQVATSSGAGTVTSVAMTVPSILSVSGTPITTSGTLAVTLATQSANLVFAGPTSGGAAGPTFRSLVSADLPTIPTSKLSYAVDFGGTLSNDAGGTTAIAVTAGGWWDCLHGTYMTLPAITTKTLATAWAVGSSAGLLDTGTVGNNTYHIHAITRTDTGVVDILASLSSDNIAGGAIGAGATATVTLANPGVFTLTAHGLQVGSSVVFTTTGTLSGFVSGTQYFVVAANFAANTFSLATAQGGTAINTTGSQSGTHTITSKPVMPANYTLYRRIGSIMRSGGAIRLFTQFDDMFLLTAIVADVNAVFFVQTAVTRALSVPLGIKVRWFGNVGASGGTTLYSLLITSFEQTDVAASGANATASLVVVNTTSYTYLQVETDTSGQVRSRSNGNTNSCTLVMNTMGWFDGRGKSQ